MHEKRPRLMIAGVMGSGREEHAALAEPLGARLAELGYHLLTGGGGGVMRSVSRGFSMVTPRRGLTLGILPGMADASGYSPPGGYPNEFVEIPVVTHLPLSGERGEDLRSRNHINVLTADCIIALPGGAGTRSEVRLALRYRKPLLLYLGPDGRIDGLRGDEAPRASSLGEVDAWLQARFG